jgi:hypothetical protein
VLIASIQQDCAVNSSLVATNLLRRHTAPRASTLPSCRRSPWAACLCRTSYYQTHVVSCRTQIERCLVIGHVIRVTPHDQASYLWLVQRTSGEATLEILLCASWPQSRAFGQLLEPGPDRRSEMMLAGLTVGVERTAHPGILGIEFFGAASSQQRTAVPDCLRSLLNKLHLRTEQVSSGQGTDATRKSGFTASPAFLLYSLLSSNRKPNSFPTSHQRSRLHSGPANQSLTTPYITARSNSARLLNYCQVCSCHSDVSTYRDVMRH